MNLLAGVLRELLANVPSDARIRIGDQLEAGPYEHTGVGGVFRGNHGDLIFCAADEAPEEEAQAIDDDLPVVWKP